MRTTDLFKNNRSAKRLNESLQKTFGKHVDLKSMDLPRLEDARNKLRTQIHDARSHSGFNENIENEALTQAQWMLDAINAEIIEREEFIADPHVATVTEESDGVDVDKFNEIMSRFDSDMNDLGGYGQPDYDKILALLNAGEIEKAGAEVEYSYSDQDGGELRHADGLIDDLYNSFEWLVGEANGDSEPGGSYDGSDDADALASAGFGSDEDYGSYGEGVEFGSYTNEEIAQKIFNDNPNIKTEDDILDAAYPLVVEMFKGDKKRAQHLFNYDEDFSSDLISSYRWLQTEHAGQDELVAMEKAPPGSKAERMVKHIKKGYAKDGKLTDKEKSIAYATAWKQHNKEKNESIESGDNMTQLREGEIQQASAIVNAKTMVDRVGRWIEELSGMENDTLLQLGDSIRDEMSADLAKQFISQVAPAIQQALETLKGSRETLASGVRMLTGEEQGAEMLGAEPGADLGAEMGPAEPDAMNAGDELGGFEEPAGDEFGASDAAAGGLGDTGRAQRESIDRSNNLLRILAG